MSYTYSDSSSRGGKAKPTVPSKHEAQVNYDNLLELGETYTLGEYTFTVTATTIPQTGLIDVIARATGPQGKVGAKTKQISAGSEIKGWYLEANDTTADIYVIGEDGADDFTAVSNSILVEPCDAMTNNGTRSPMHKTETGKAAGLISTAHHGDGWFGLTLISTVEKSVYFSVPGGLGYTGSYDIDGTRIYYRDCGASEFYGGATSYGNPQGLPVTSEVICENIGGSLTEAEVRNVMELLNFHVAEEGSESTHLIGRFAIDAREAGATEGTGGEEEGWEDVDDGQEPIYPGEPGYPDPEDPDYPGDDMPYYPPAKTLYVTINGALSGRHNDPLNDTSYSYLPSDQIAQTQYGSGGIGGNGGGGGAGASTIIVRKFATKKADSKTFILKPKRHGYGSGGGKGGNGGDGCILVYY